MTPGTLQQAQSHTAAIPVWRQLRWRLIVAFVLLAVLPATFVGAVTSSLMREQAQTRMFTQLESVADLKESQIETWVADRQAAMELLLTRPVREQLTALTRAGGNTPENLAQVNALLAEASDAGEASVAAARFRNLFFYQPDGRVIAASDPALIGRVVTRQPYYVLSLQGAHIEPPYYAVGTNELVMVITQPLSTDGGAPHGVLAAELDLDTLGDIMLARSGLGKTGETYLVSQESNYLLTPSRSEGYSLTRAYHSVGIDGALRGEDGARVYNDYRDPPTQVAGVYRWIPALEAGLLAEIGREEVLATSARSVLISGAIALGASLVALLFGLFVAAQIARPILQLTRMVAHISDGNLDERVALGQRNELGLLAAGFNSMADRLRETLQGLEQRITDSTAELRNALGERERTLSELRESFDARDQLQATIRGMSSPVLPVLEGVLVMPIIGVVDSARAAMLTGALLQAIEQHRAKVLILDVTGVPIIDTQVARVLIQAADATRLLGAEPVLVGIRPELAHTIVGLGLDLSSLVSQADLQSGIRYAATRRGRGEQARSRAGKQ